jgi:hypothetical protein
MTDLDKEREGYRYYAKHRKTVHHGSQVPENNPYPVDSAQFVSWQDGFDLAAYDDSIGDLEDEL